ncbi:hypothetical protein OROMI_033224 [Orobanche minor]
MVRFLVLILGHLWLRLTENFDLVNRNRTVRQPFSILCKKLFYDTDALILNTHLTFGLFLWLLIFSSLIWNYLLAPCGEDYFGSELVHDGSETPVFPPQYVDPYELLEEDGIHKSAPLVF